MYVDLNGALARKTKKEVPKMKKKDEYYSHISANEILEEFCVQYPAGLSSQEASERLEKYGKNKMADTPKTPFWSLILSQFEDKLVRLLLLAVFLSLATSLFDSAYWDVVEASIILLILVLNAIVGVFQENRTEKSIDALKACNAVCTVVRRDDKPVCIPADGLVPGDLVELSVGDRVPADIRLVELRSTTFRTAEYILSGESKEITKTVDCIAESQTYPLNMAFSGTDVVYGRAIGVVLFTGSATELGSIHQLVTSQSDGKTPLQTTLDKFGTALSKLIGCICVLVFAITMMHWYCLQTVINGNLVLNSFGAAFIHSFKVAVALGVAAIPEGLPAVVTTCLSLGARHLSRQNAIVRDLGSVETLGRCNVVCCDKTGTLTTGAMSVAEVCTLNSQGELQMYGLRNTQYSVRRNSISARANEDADKSNEGALTEMKSLSLISPFSADKALYYLSLTSVLCNEAVLQHNADKNVTEKIGSATEAALLVMSEKLAFGTCLQSYKSDAFCPPSIEGERVIHRRCNLSTGIESPKSTGAPRTTSFRSSMEACWKREAILEFTRCRKSMSILCSFKGMIKDLNNPFFQKEYSTDFNPSESFLFVKGAPEELLARSTSVMLSNGSHIPLTDVIRQKMDNELSNLASSKSLRLIGFAFRKISKEILNLPLSDPSRFVEVEDGLTYVGSCGMLDPPREEIAEAISQCRRSGIRVIVITGDRKETAVSLCQQIGLLPSVVSDSSCNENASQNCLDNFVYTGVQFNSMSYKLQKKAIMSAVIFCRADPSLKMLLVQLLQEQNLICAMTGDGVNDAPALKKADMGIAMGSGTEVAKSASNMILADDNFATIVSAIHEGRCVFRNTKLFIRYLISSNIGEVGCVLAISFFPGLPELLTPIQLLWVNLVTDGLPAMALSFNSPDIDIMSEPPRPVDEPIIDSWILFTRYLFIGGYIGFATVASYLWWFLSSGYTFNFLSDINSYQRCMRLGREDCNAFIDPKTARAICLSTLVMVEMFNALNALSENNSLLVVRPTSNVWLLAAIAFSLLLHFIIMYVPFFANIFGISPLGVPQEVLKAAPLWSVVLPAHFSEWGVVLLCSFPVIIIDETMKCVARKIGHRTKSISQKKSIS